MEIIDDVLGGAAAVVEEVIGEVVHEVVQVEKGVIHETGDAVHDIESFAETTFRAVVDAAGKLLNIVEGLVIVGSAERVGVDPDVVIEGLHWPIVDKFTVSLAGLTLEEVKIKATLSLTNPNFIPLPLVQISASVVVSGKTVASIDGSMATIAAHRSGDADFLLVLHYLELIKDVAYDFQTGIVKFTVKVELTLEIPIVGRYTLHYEWDVKFPLPIIAFSALTQVGLVKSSSSDQEESTVDIALYLSIDNPNVFDMDVNSLRCEVSLDDVVIGSVELKKPAGTIRKKKMGQVRVPFSFKPKKFGQEFCQKLLNGRSIGYSLRGTIDVQTPYGPMKMPIIVKEKSGTSIPLLNEPSAP